MNCKNTKLGFLVAAALMSMNHAAKAQFSAKTPKKFVPLEQLSTEERAKYERLINELESLITIDWDSVIIGIDENGKLVLRSRSIDEIKGIANPSCWTAPY